MPKRHTGKTVSSYSNSVAAVTTHQEPYHGASDGWLSTSKSPSGIVVTDSYVRSARECSARESQVRATANGGQAE